MNKYTLGVPKAIYLLEEYGVVMTASILFGTAMAVSSCFLWSYWKQVLMFMLVYARARTVLNAWLHLCSQLCLIAVFRPFHCPRAIKPKARPYTLAVLQT